MKRLLCVLLLCALPACGDVDDDQAKIRMVNALAEYDTLDLLVGDQMKIVDLPFGERSTGVRIGVKDRENEDPGGGGSTSTTAADSTTSSTDSTTTTDGSSTTTTTSTSTTTTTIPTGSRTLQVFVDSVASRLIEQSVTLTAQRRYTFYAYEDATSARLIVNEETRQNFVGGKLKIRVADMAPSSGGLDVYVLQEGQDIAGQNPVTTNLAPPDVTEYFDIDPGTYSVVLAQAGTKTALLDTGSIELDGGTLATVIALDNAGGGLPLGSLLAID